MIIYVVECWISLLSKSILSMAKKCSSLLMSIYPPQEVGFMIIPQIKCSVEWIGCPENFLRISSCLQRTARAKPILCIPYNLNLHYFSSTQNVLYWHYIRYIISCYAFSLHDFILLRRRKSLNINECKKLWSYLLNTYFVQRNQNLYLFSSKIVWHEGHGHTYFVNQSIDLEIKLFMFSY